MSSWNSVHSKEGFKIQIIQSSPFAQWLQIGRSCDNAWRWIWISAWGVVACFAGSGSASDDWGRRPYPTSPQLSEPRDVFAAGPAASYPGNWAGPASRLSPYVDYRCQTFANPENRFPPPTDPSREVRTTTFPHNLGGNPESGSGDPGGWMPAQPLADPAPDCPGNCGDCQLYTSFASMAYIGGQTPSTGYSELFVPLLQSHTDLLYGDVRGLFNERSAYQGSFGGGLRSLIGDAIILGGYGFYDYRHSELRNAFQQASLGVELMTWRWEVRSNGYLPTSDGSRSSSGSGAGTAVLQNGAFFLQGTQQRALSGVDAEFGMLVAADPIAQKELRAFVGAYYFNGPPGSQDLPGVSGRLEARIYDLAFLGQGSRLELGVISTYDEVNRMQVTGLVNVRIALGRSTCPGGLSLIERRMLDRPVRRYDLLTTNESTAAERATPVINGSPATSVVFVRPGDDLKTLVEGASNHSLIIVEGGGGPHSVANGVVLNPGQSLVGGGTQLNVVGNTTGHVAVVTVPGSRPTIDRPNTLGPVVTTAPNSSILGVDLHGGNHGIFGYQTDNLLISDIKISQTGSDGLSLDTVHGFTLRDVTITQTGGIGAFLQNVNDSSIERLTISQTVGSALYYNCGMNVLIDGLTVDATGATDDAVRFHTQMHSTFTNFDIRNSAHNGLTIASSTVVSFDRIALRNIAGDGIEAHQSGTFDFSHLTMNDVGGSGLVVDNTALVSVNSSIFTNVQNVISYLNVANYISGSGNVATGYSTLFTGTTSGGGSIQFTQPNATAP